jgi:hypothetical protein
MDQTAAEAAWLGFSDKIYELALTIFGGSEIPIGPKGSADPKVVAATLLIRTTSNFKGAMVLARQGMIVETRTLTRCCVENLLWLGRLAAEGDSFVKEMGLDEARSRQKRAKFILDMPLPVEEATETRLKETYENLSTQWPKAKFLNPKGVAEGGQIESIYLQYSQLSADAAHPSLTALCRYLLHEEGTSMRGIDVCPVPRSGEMASTVHIACIALISACVAFNQIVGPTIPGRAINGIVDEFDALKQATGIS